MHLFQGESRFREELELAKKAFMDLRREAEAAAEKEYSLELRQIESELDAEAEKLLGDNPVVSETGGTWDLQRSRLPAPSCRGSGHCSSSPWFHPRDDEHLHYCARAMNRAATTARGTTSSTSSRVRRKTTRRRRL